MIVCCVHSQQSYLAGRGSQRRSRPGRKDPRRREKAWSSFRARCGWLVGLSNPFQKVYVRSEISRCDFNWTVCQRKRWKPGESQLTYHVVKGFCGSNFSTACEAVPPRLCTHR
jgi:hypothetical protein